MLNKKHLKIFFAAFVISSIAFLILIPYVKNRKNPVSYDRVLMGTVVEITLKKDDPEAAEAAFKEIERLEKSLSHYKGDSDVSKINQNAGKGPVKVSSEVIDVVEAAVKIAKLSNGAFDPTVGSFRVWDFSKESGRVPSKKEIQEKLPLVDYKAITLDKEKHLVGLKKKGMALDLGGVAKGYIVGKAMEALKTRGPSFAIIRAGGDMMVYDKNDSVEPFTIGIQHPRIKDRLIAKLKIRNGAISTSGDYERFFIKNGVRYHHIIDPKTGFPADKTQSVTIVSQDPTLADALSTAIFVMGPEKGMELVKKLDGVEAVIIDAKAHVSISKGLEGNFTGF